jgi:RNA-directed DNA polymerase
LDKTKITHIDEGFDFLGYNFRKYKGKLLVKPSQKSTKAICWKIKTLVLNARAKTQDFLIHALNPVIRGWSNYHRHNATKETFAKLDRYVWTVTWQWGKHRHRNKGHKWIARKYWHSKGNRNWVFQTKENTLLKFSDVTIRRHNIPKLQANPYIDRKYFLDRLERMKNQIYWIQSKLSFFALPPNNRVVKCMSVLR